MQGTIIQTAIETRKLADKLVYESNLVAHYAALLDRSAQKGEVMKHYQHSFDAAIAAKKELDTKFQEFVLQGRMFLNSKR